ncbi:MAG: vitamin B12 dependent-methionine synthase activation domain-containing protein [Candidatus Eisenbacteria bacterium]|nr:vitamin B12 dependent-methionine synthase activation domain-containing protein [Candidatus Eisenbacteria bacterium]
MRRILHIPVQEVIPSLSAVLEGQGIPRSSEPDARTKQLAQDARLVFEEKAQPAGVVMEIARDEFKIVFEGEGRNEDESPVSPIYQASDALALFVVTIGESVCNEISRMFREKDSAFGSMLDSAASGGTEMTAQAVEDFYHKQLKDSGRLNEGQGTLRFSPGYCGWDISAQKKLFGVLNPEEIGITLNDSYLMEPIKSISGVIIVGRKDIFKFEDVFSFCRDCGTHDCQERIKKLFD